MGTFDKVKKIVVDQLGVNEADVQILSLIHISEPTRH